MIRLLLATAGLLALWTAGGVMATVDGWWREPIAPPGDARAFANAATDRIQAQHAGNAVLALLEDGEVYAEHAVSVGDPVDLDTVFQVASLSK